MLLSTRGDAGGAGGPAPGLGGLLAELPAYSLVDGLQELPLVLPDFGVVDLLQQLRVLVDEPRLPEDIGCGVLNLRQSKQSNCAQVHRPGFT